jgi:serine/threonine protein kinase/tetratricopeptide (TPR) repeat protein
VKNKTDLTRRGYKGSEAPATVQDTGVGAQLIIDASLGSTVPTVGSRVGRYRLLKELGAGGMGVVFEALDPELDRKVAIKLLRARFDKAQLVREARALARLSHPNVVTIHDVGEVDGRSFIAMELIDGVTFRAWLAQQARSFREILDVLIAAGRGLAAAHAAQLVHRDFKPENVMVGRDGRVRVLDFGIVSAVAARGTSVPPSELVIAADGVNTQQRNVSSSFTGTPAYMAPEQLTEHAIDERADQFSFCVVLWEAMYGERPFQSAMLSERVHGIAAVKSVEAPASSAPAWLHRLIVRGLSGNLGARHASMEALIAAIEAGLEREVASARLIGRRYEPIQASRNADAKPIERALDRLTGTVVTIHRVAAESGKAEDSTAARVQLARAYRDLAALRHPNLVSVLDFGFEDQREPYFVLDLRDVGVDLRAALREREPPVLDYLVQLLRALSHLHRHRMLIGRIALDDVFVIEHQIKLLPLRVALQPEAANDNASDVSVDLLAFGRLAEELLTPELSHVELDPKVKPVLSRLLDAEPSARFTSADAVIDALAQALGRSLATETFQTRESRLRAAPLLGREAEVERLSDAVKAVCKGHGGAWLISGESGVGKSRLLDEVRTLGVVQGALVLRGQEESEGASPYRLFRDALRWLALLTDLDELEAGVLLPIVPDLSRILGRVVAPAPELDAASMHARTCDVVTGILRRQKQPVVLLLEDVQWSRSDSLDLLKHVIPITGESSLLVVATDRDDERPSLHATLPGMQSLELQRLSQDAVEKLLVAMIGEAARRPEVVRLLWRETEGNAFFLVEVVRALAEESGGMARIGAGALPDKVFAGGIRRAVERRLQRVPEEARPLLRIAAVIGRTLDLSLLAALAPEVKLERWCAECVESSVLERTSESIRFAHDKLREGLLAELPGAEQRRLSRLVAEAVERVAGGGAEHYALLAYHYGKAEDRAKEARYAALSGEQAIRSFAIAEGSALLSRALVLTAESSETATTRARLHRLLGEACYYEGRFDQALSHLDNGLVQLGIRVPSSRWQWLLLLLRQALLQVAIYMGLVRSSSVSTADAQHANEASWTAGRAAYIYSYDMDMLRSLSLSLLSVNQVRNGAQENPFGLGVLGYAAASVKLKAGGSYFRRARQSASNSPDNQRALADVLHLQASYLISVGQLDDAERVALESVAVAERLGDRMSASVGLNIASICDYLRGNLPRMLSRSQSNEAYCSGEHRMLRACSLAIALCELGQPDKALETLQAHSTSDQAPQLRVARATVLGVVALAQARRGALQEAWAAARACLELGVAGELVPASCSIMLTGPMVATLMSWAGSGDDSLKKEYRATAHTLLRHLRAYGRVCRPGTAMAPYFEGHVRALCGDSRGAQRAWLHAAKTAGALGMRHYEGLAELELSRASAADSPTHAQHLRRAEELLIECGVSDYARLSDIGLRRAADS